MHNGSYSYWDFLNQTKLKGNEAMWQERERNALDYAAGKDVESCMWSQSFLPLGTRVLAAMSLQHPPNSGKDSDRPGLCSVLGPIAMSRDVRNYDSPCLHHVPTPETGQLLQMEGKCVVIQIQPLGQ